MKKSELQKIINEEIKNILTETLKSDWNNLSSDLSMPLAKMSKFVLDNLDSKQFSKWKKAKSDFENVILEIDKIFRYGDK